MIDRETVDHVARLARLGLTDQEAELYQDQLAKILGFVDQICQLEHTADPQSSRPGPESLTLRADVVTPSLPREVVLANAPDSEAGHFRAPPVLE